MSGTSCGTVLALLWVGKTPSLGSALYSQPKVFFVKSVFHKIAFSFRAFAATVGTPAC